MRESLSYIDELDPDTQVIVRESYRLAINRALWFSAKMGLCGAVAAFFIHDKALPVGRVGAVDDSGEPDGEQAVVVSTGR